MDSPAYEAITFEDAFVCNATRAADPSTTAATLGAFDVWGFLNEHDGTVFSDQDVIFEYGKWSYIGTQYWVPGQTYYFSALAPMNSANIKENLATGDAAKKGLGTITFTNTDGTEDLLYSSLSVKSKDIHEVNTPVTLQFKHLLSKLKFTFRNGFVTDNVSIKVTNVRMDVPSKASIDLAQDDYSKDWIIIGDGVLNLDFGDVETIRNNKGAEAANERLTIPTDRKHKYTITFDIEVFIGDLSVYKISKESSITGVALEMGKAYNFITEINPENLEFNAIVFDVVQVDKWI
jgi:hypothetical protein